LSLTAPLWPVLGPVSAALAVDPPAKPPPDPAEVRAKDVLNLKPGLRAYVFAGAAFPEPAFGEPARATELLGPHKLRVTVHGRDFGPVASADAPGAYGAVIEVVPESGRPMRRLATVFRLPGESPAPDARFPDAGSLAKAAGLDASAVTRQWALIKTVTQAKGKDGVTTDRPFSELAADPRFARLLAGLSAGKTGGEGVPGRWEDAFALDRQWWVDFKRKRDGLDKLFPNPVAAPTKFDGPPATVVREGPAAEAGFKPDAAERMDAALKEFAADTDEGFAVCVVRRGVIVLHRAYGTRDGRPMTLSDKSWMASITKPMAASLMLMLVDRGLVSVDDTPDRFLPGLKGLRTATPDQPMTVRHIYTHCAGMSPYRIDADGDPDIEDRVADIFPALRVGQVWAYNSTSLSLGGKCIEAVSGEALPQFFRRHLLEPLGMNDTDVVGTHADARSVPLDIAKFGQMLLNKGSYGNLRFFKPETFALMVEKAPAPTPDGKPRFYGMGLDGKPNKFGHGSAAAATFSVDADRQLVVVVTRNRQGKNQDKYMGRFWKALEEGIEK
jgi:CubicO group peptidase (beta-lactamase class C family)